MHPQGSPGYLLCCAKPPPVGPTGIQSVVYSCLWLLTDLGEF